MGPDGVPLGWGRWHTPSELDTDIDAFVEHLFGLLRDMLGPDMRARALWAWPFAFRGFPEAFDGQQWSAEQEMGMTEDWSGYCSPQNRRTCLKAVRMMEYGQGGYSTGGCT